MNFQEALAKAERLSPQKINNDFFEFVKKIQKELVDYNRNALNKDSEDIYGKAIGFYSRATEEITEGRKQFGEPFDLEETGVFLESIFASVSNDSIFFGANDPKLNDIILNLLSKEILGLRDKDLQTVISERFLPFFLNYFRNELT